MNIVDVEVKYGNGERFFLIITDSVFYPLLERTMCRKWFVPSNTRDTRYEVLNAEFIEELEEEYARFTERRFEEY
jgi:hypothetical protein